MSSSLARSSSRILQAVCPRPRTSLRHAHRHFTPALIAIPRRAFTSTPPRPIELSARPQIEPAVLLSHPSPQDLEEAEIDAELIPPLEAVVNITDRAAQQLLNIHVREANPDAGLRISVESGGCHGYQYKMALTKRREPDDYHFSRRDIAPSNVYVDAVSLPLLKGATIDYATELIGSSFRILDNPQAKGSGCGCGVSWEANI